MPEVRRIASGSTPEEVLAAEVARLSAALADLQATVLARTAGIGLLEYGAADSGGTGYRMVRVPN